MEIIHSFAQRRARKNVKGPVQALLTDRNGSFFLWEDSPTTRYSGFFWYDCAAKKMFKIIEHIKLKELHKKTKIVNSIFAVEKRSRGVAERAFMPSGYSSLVYGLESLAEIEVFLDMKESYDNREWGRQYDVSEEKGCLIMRFSKKTDCREDGSHDREEYSLYLAIAGHDAFSREMEWVQREYPADRERNSPPFTRYVLKAGSLRGKSFVFSISRSRNAAINKARALAPTCPALLKKGEKSLLALRKQRNVGRLLSSSQFGGETKMACLAALASLDSLVVHSSSARNIFAGLPWLFQFWPRDSLVSLKALGLVHPMLAKEIIAQYLSQIKEDGHLPNVAGSDVGSADALGWLFLRAGKKSGGALLKRAVTKAAEGLLTRRTEGMLELNAPKETWMDTQNSDDGRAGKRIEIQALGLALYRAAHGATGNGKYSIREQELKKAVRTAFWNGKELADGENDPTARPNIFIAAYAYPEILSREEWESCFESAIKKLWLPWGGLATIDTSHPLFRKEHTGQDNASYHRGDSWFWLNNLAAIVLHRTNRGKFRKYIGKILAASTQEILWQGAVGHHAELSSASELRSQGCLSQAWSSAMFVELVLELAEEEGRQ